MYSAIESNVEAIVRKTVKRGTCYLTLNVERDDKKVDTRINEGLLRSYYVRLTELSKSLQIAADVRLDSLLALPGVVRSLGGSSHDAESDWPVIEIALHQAMDNLTRMRSEEGASMAADLAGNCQILSSHLDKIADRVPLIIENYQQRLRDRLTQLLAEFDVRVQPQDVIREVGVFAERVDVSEEIVRLRSHLDQFNEILKEPESTGRKLDFLTQEMFREINTIGSKANDVEVSRHVVEMKAVNERLREMVQNVE
jgi:uncharacterized protein (TIGR00255 family)